MHSSHLSGIPIWQQSQHDKSCIVVYSISILHYINVHRLVVYYHAIQKKQVIYREFFLNLRCCWWFRNPKQPHGMYENPVNNGIFIIYQLVIAGFMNHQRELTFHPHLWLSTNFRKAPGTRCCPWLWLRLPWLYPPWAPPDMEKSSGEAMWRAVVVMVVRWQANTDKIHWWFTYQLLHGLWFGHHMVFQICIYATKSLAPRSGFKTWIPWQLFVALPAIPNSVPLQKQNEFGERWPFPFSFLWTEARNWSAQSTAQQQGVLQNASWLKSKKH